MSRVRRFSEAERRNRVERYVGRQLGELSRHHVTPLSAQQRVVAAAAIRKFAEERLDDAELDKATSGDKEKPEGVRAFSDDERDEIARRFHDEKLKGNKWAPDVETFVESVRRMTDEDVEKMEAELGEPTEKPRRGSPGMVI